MQIGVVKEIKQAERRGRAHARRHPRAGPAAATTCSCRPARAGLRLARRGRTGARIVDTAEEVWGGRRAAPGQGQGADRARVRAHAAQPDPLHVPPPRGRRRRCTEALAAQRAPPAVAYETVQLPDRFAAAAHADERDRRRLAARSGAYLLVKPDGPGDSAGRRSGRRSRRMSLCSGAASSAPTRPRSPRGLGPTSSSWTSTSTACAISMMLGRQMSHVLATAYDPPHLLEADLVIGAVLIPGRRAAAGDEG